MTIRTRKGFTLVELLVVITIIGMLMALIFPALSDVMETASQTTCRARLVELSKSMHNFHHSNHRLPGYNHMLFVRQDGKGQNKNVSWVVPALESLSEEDYRSITRGGATVNEYFKLLTCPNDPPQQFDASISYVANCGMQDAGGGTRSYPDRVGNGVFHREGSSGQGGVFVKMTMDMIKGKNHTIMFSENLQAGKWTSVSEAEVGILWWMTEGDVNFPEPEVKMINKGKNDLVVGDPNYARPSSNHPGGVLVVFCDTSARFLSQEIAYGEVYCKLMMSDASKAGRPGQKNSPLPPMLRSALDTRMLDP